MTENVFISWENVTENAASERARTETINVGYVYLTFKTGSTQQVRRYVRMTLPIGIGGDGSIDVRASLWSAETLQLRGNFME